MACRIVEQYPRTVRTAVPRLACWIAAMTKPGKFQNSDADLASSIAPGNLKFQREDWSLFRTVEGLQQRAGVSLEDLAPLVMKELTDNGLDTDTEVSVGKLPNGGYFVEDQGTRIPPEEVATLFSINRPMISTKHLRLPVRGAQSAMACAWSLVPFWCRLDPSSSSLGIAGSSSDRNVTAAPRW
jgi:hypothetical protein